MASSGDATINANEIEFDNANPDLCTRRCCAEWNYPGFFSLDEGRRTLDVGATFGTRRPVFLAGKFVCAAAIWSTLVINWLGFSPEHAAWFLVYMTHWSLIFACLYSALSILHSICPPSQPSMLSGSTIGVMPKLTWLLATLSVHWTLFASLLYWAFVFDGVVTYAYVSAHGGAMIFVWILAFGCDRIPLRWKHFGMVWLLLLLYVVWTVLHGTVLNSALGGNPANPDTDTIYPALDWANEPLMAVILSVIALVVIAPAAYWLLWLLSLYSFPCGWSGQNRRYLSHNKPGEDDEDAGDVEVGSSRPSNINVYERDSS